MVLSPFVNYFNIKSKNIECIRRKFILDFSIEYKNISDYLKYNPIKGTSDDIVRNFEWDIEKSNEKICIKISLIDNLKTLLFLIKKYED